MLETRFGVDVNLGKGGRRRENFETHDLLEVKGVFSLGGHLLHSTGFLLIALHRTRLALLTPNALDNRFPVVGPGTA